MNKMIRVFFLVIALGLFITSQASATVINFDSQGYTGPSMFADASPIPQTITIGNATFKGGVVLQNTSFMPANQTAIYGTASFVNGMSNPLEIDFSSSISNIFFDLYNGWYQDMSYHIYDNAGHSATFVLPSNTSSGQTLVGFAAVGDKVFVESTTFGTSTWDFFIDNIHYNETLPVDLGGNPVPEPSTIILFGAGLAGVAFMRRKKA